MKDIEIDGDKFLLAFPDSTEVSRMKPSMATDEELQGNVTRFQSEQFCVLSGEGNTLYRSQNNSANAFHIRKDGTARSARFGQVRFRPVLIPVTDDGVVDDTARLNPDGAIVEGGSLFCDGKPVTPDDQLVDLSGCKIGDTLGEPMLWMWWHGKLYYAGIPYLVQVNDALAMVRA